ncbi:MAG: ZPR1 zinc finger domain-containing protein [Candidatus Hermodarchaeota archaeon]
MSQKAKDSEEQFSFKCPACSKGIVNIQKTVYDLPDKDKMLIIKFECNKCNFSKNDIIPLTTNFDPGILTLKVINEEDLKSKIYRSPTGILEIPELELSVQPGANAEFYYTNVEGILYRFESAVSIYKNNLKKDDPEFGEVSQILEDIKKAINGNLKFTLKITDNGGGSYIIPIDKSKYSFEKLESKELD